MTRALADQAARDLITGVDGDGLQRTLFVEAGAGSGKTSSLVDRIVALVASGAVELQHLAAITFTEKAAAELRDRVRSTLEHRLATAGQEGDPTLTARLLAAVEQVDVAAISTLHAFAQRILTEHPLEAGLPPNIEVMDEVASELQFEDRWRDFRRGLLDDERLAEVVLLADAAGVKLDHLRDLALEFDRNWDLAQDPTRIPWEREDVPRVDLTPLAEAARRVLDRRGECTDGADKLLAALDDEVTTFLDEVEEADTTGRALALLARSKPSFAYGNRGSKNNWPDITDVREQARELGPLRDELRRSVIEGLLHQLAITARDFVVDLGRRRVAAGRLEFHDLLVLARDLLHGRHADQVRAALGARYRRLLLDEFQDTDPIQIQIAVLLASTQQAPPQDWREVRTEPGRLFFVGDPKQSIYRFRRADIRLFLEARDAFGIPEPVRLTTNFRTSAPIIDWVNATFATIMEPKPGSQPEYQPLDAAPQRGTAATGPAVALLGTDELPDGLNADGVRSIEAGAVVTAVITAVTERWQVSDRLPGGGEVWRDARLGDITILLPARTSLPALERALEARDIPYRAETSSLVYSTPEVRDLLLAVRALSDVTDELALVATLRSPLFGCGDDDLVRFKLGHGGRFTLGAAQPDGVPGDDPVATALAQLRALHLEAHWLSPSALLDRLCRDRRLFELGYATGRPRDLWRRLRFVVDHARAWEEAEAGTLREYVDWARFQASESARVAESILPETDDDAVRIMTIHGSKGLEFPITIVSGTTTAPSSRNRGVQVLWPPEGPVGIKVGATVFTEQFEAFKPLDEQMNHDERVRLLYVACTRARDHLVVSLHRKARAMPVEDGSDRSTNAELLAWGARSAPHAATIAPTSARLPAPSPGQASEDVPDGAAWSQERAAALAAGGRPRSIGASAIQELIDAQRDAGDEKDPLDIELPAWRKGRYGTAIGRAVHGVLQTIDLASGEGIESAVAGQAAAEAVVGSEADVEHLVRAALTSPTVRAAAAATERWRETYVATTVGGRTLEGYLDLLFRDEDGHLVVVDYKTASSSSDLDQRTAHYRSQGGAYAVAVEQAAGEAIARVVFVYLTEDGAFDRELPDLKAAMAEVRAVLADL